MRIRIDEKRFGAEVILRDVALEVSVHTRLAILGPSGTGKSTFLRILAGLDDDFRGQIEHRPAAIGMVFQEPFLMNWKSAMDNLTLVTRATSAEALHWLAQVGLAGLEHRLPQQLSVGQQRRVSLARAFSAKPELLILDEAFTSLDDETAHLMRAHVADYVAAHPCALILATHQSEDLKLTSEEFTIRDGALIEARAQRS